MPEATLKQLGNHIGIWRWDFTRQTLTCNAHLMEIIGHPAVETTLPAQVFEELVDPEDLSRVKDQMDRHLSEGVPFIEVFRLRHSDGHNRHIRVRGGVIRGSNVDCQVVVGTATDVSEEVEAAKALRASQIFLFEIAQNVPGAVIRFRFDDVGTAHYDFISDGCESIWGLPASVIQNEPNILAQFVVKADLDGILEALALAARDLSEWRSKWRIVLPDGRKKLLEGHARPAEQADGSLVWTGVITDVTREGALRAELNRTSLMLAQAQKMEAIGRISGGVAHDFNNLLAIILGNAELMRLDSSEANMNDCINQIIFACERGASLTRHLLTFARQSTLSPQDSDLNKVVLAMDGMLKRTIRESVIINTTLTAGLWPTKVDPSFVERSLLNLVINARDAMPKGGQITIETANVRITDDYVADTAENIPVGRYVLLAVSDNGTGIPKELIDKVVEPFVTTKGPTMGSGLGLAVVDGFVRQSGGVLRIYSEVGIGTTIKIYLPASAASPSGEILRKEEFEGPEGAQGGRILLVEDEAAIRDNLKRSLVLAGFVVTATHSGDAAYVLLAARADHFDIVLTDVVMPGTLQGPGLASKALEINPKLRIVFMSGYANEASMNGNHIRPTDRFLMKPVQRAELLRVLRSELAQAADTNVSDIEQSERKSR